MADTDRTLGTWIHRRARLGAGAVAVEVGERSVPYGMLAERIDLATTALADLGVLPGDRVAYSGPPGVAYLETLFAATSLGAAFTPINPVLPSEAAAWILDDAGPRVLVRAASSSLAVAASGSSDPTVVSIDDSAASDGVSWAVAASAELTERPDVGEDALALLMYTSGTTGRPKGVMLTHANLLANALNMASVVDFLASDRLMAVASFYRMGGLAVTLHALLQGAAVLVSDAFEPDAVLRELSGRRATILFTFPEMLRGLTDQTGWAEADLSRLRYAFIGGAPVLGQLAGRYQQRGIGVVQGYGLTEASPLILFATAAETARGLGTAGSAPMFVDLRVVDADGSDLGPGAPGELLARGPNVMRGYWRRPDATAAALRGGWLHTGDVFERTSAGGFRYLGRVEDVIQTAQGSVTTGQVERALEGQPGVAEVVGLGLPTADAFERPVAAVVAAPGASIDVASLEAAMSGMGGPLAGTRVVVVDAIPKSAAGKPQRDEVRRMVRSELGAALIAVERH